jgi:hypothetical protein
MLRFSPAVRVTLIDAARVHHLAKRRRAGILLD